MKHSLSTVTKYLYFATPQLRWPTQQSSFEDDSVTQFPVIYHLGREMSG